MDVTGSFKKPALSFSVSKHILGQSSWRSHQPSPRILSACQSLRHYCCENGQEHCWAKSKWEQTGNRGKEATLKLGFTRAQTQNTDQRQACWTVLLAQSILKTWNLTFNHSLSLWIWPYYGWTVHINTLKGMEGADLRRFETHVCNLLFSCWRIKDLYTNAAHWSSNLFFHRSVGSETSLSKPQYTHTHTHRDSLSMVEQISKYIENKGTSTWLAPSGEPQPF